MDPRAMILVLTFVLLAGLTLLTDPDPNGLVCVSGQCRFSLSDLFDTAHAHHEHLVVLLVILAFMAVFLPMFLPPLTILYTVIAAAGLVATIGLIDFFTGWT